MSLFRNVFKNTQKTPYNCNSQKFTHFLVLDFESTCDKQGSRCSKVQTQEIIEFPCLKVASATFQVENVFHQYVQPKLNKVLSPFCIELTGILQEMVDGQPYFPEVLCDFETWLNRTNTNSKNVSYIFVTSGDWDLGYMLPKQCKAENLKIPLSMTSWIDIKKAFVQATGYYPRGIKDMLSKLNLKHKGRLHSGIADCYNIANILKTIGQEGFIFEKTSQLVQVLPKIKNS